MDGFRWIRVAWRRQKTLRGKSSGLRTERLIQQRGQGKGVELGSARGLDFVSAFSLFLFVLLVLLLLLLLLVILL